MATLYHLANQVEEGDKIRWRGKKSDVFKPKPRTATEVENTEDSVRVEAEGPRGGQAGFQVDENGDSRAWYGDRDMGAVDKAELPEKGVFTEPWGSR